ncbi:DUF4328 domain-containing protein [Haloferula sp. A504]|uniref:DUF4328 domain-containing protein n=1 Tax=Haloferula sp. A504 TaxID=3373601 RepID=UPI0031CBBECD|nr:DUF4328 domain-containing protein [Verrucomicrobiaceae bacterium E54]
MLPGEVAPAMAGESVNPYDTPDANPLIERSGPVSLPPGPYGAYRDNRILSRWVVGLLLFYAALQAFWLVVNLLYSFSVAATSSETLDTIVLGVERISWTVLATFVVFGVWIVRSGKNAWLFHQLKRHAANHGGRRYHEVISTTPGWCVGWYFIPIANFWKPFVAMREIFRASTTGQAAPGYLLPFWWTLWLLSSMGDQLTSRPQTGPASHWNDHLITIVWTSSSGINVALSVIAIQLVRTLTRMQIDSAHHFSDMDAEVLKRPSPGDRLTGTFLDR